MSQKVSEDIYSAYIWQKTYIQNLPRLQIDKGCLHSKKYEHNTRIETEYWRISKKVMEHHY